MGKKQNRRKVASYICDNYSECMCCGKFTDRRGGQEIKQNGKLDIMLRTRILLEGIGMSHGACSSCHRKLREEAERGRK